MTTKVEVSKRLVLVNSASSVAVKVLNVGLLVWLYQHLLRSISPDEYALYPVLMGVMEFAPLLTSILTGGLGRYVVEAYAQGDEQRVTQITSTMFPLLIAAAGCVATAGGMFIWHVDRILTIAPARVMDARIMLGLMIASLAIRLPLAPFGIGLYVRQKFVLENMINVCMQLLRIGILLALLLGVNTRVLWVVVATVSANFCQLIVTQVISRRLVPALKFQWHEICWVMARQLTSFGIWTCVSRLAVIIYETSDTLVLNQLSTALDVTCFHIGSVLHRQIYDAWGVISTPLMPALTAMYALGNEAGLKNAFLRSGKYTLWVIMPVALPLTVYPQELIALYAGAKYATAGTVLSLLTLPLLMGMANWGIWMLAEATAQVYALAWRHILVQSLNLALTLYLVGVLRMGAIGSALATLIAVGLGNLLLFWPLGWRLAHIRFAEWAHEILWLGSLPGIVAITVWMGLKFFVHISNWTTLGGCVLLGGMVYLLVLIFCFGSYERRLLQRVTTSIKSSLCPQEHF